MDDIQSLLAIEAIKRLKARYFYYLDHKDWARWKAEIWAPDAALYVPEVLDEPVVGVDAIVAWTVSRFGDVIATHYGHMPDIEILSPDSATGIWAMEDILRWLDDAPGPGGYSHIHGYGHYHETYEKLDSGWRIKSTRLSRLHVERS